MYSLDAVFSSTTKLFHTNTVSLTWVRNHHQDAVGAVLDNVRDDELENVDVALHQVKTALALLLSSASSHHHHLGVGCHTVVWQNNRKGDVRMEYQDNSFSGLNTRLESSFYLFILFLYFCHCYLCLPQSCASWGKGIHAAGPWPHPSTCPPSHQSGPAHRTSPDYICTYV